MIGGLKPIRHLKLSRSVSEALETAIVRGELEPGTPLVDRQVAAALDVSRTPVREALRHLEASGLVRRQDRGGVTGWVVAEFREQDVRELFQLRSLLEPVGLEWLKRNWDDETARRLATFFDDFEPAFGRDQYESYIERDRSFHQQIVSLSHNTRIIYFYRIMDRQIDRIRHFLSIGYEGRMDRIADEHRALCAAIGVGDMDLAIERLVFHLRQGEEAMIRFGHERNLLADVAEPNGESDAVR